MPRYELQITDPNGGDPFETTYDSDDSLGADDSFQYEGGMLRVTSVEAAGDPSCDARLVCAPQGGRPHYF